jgi:EpsI family protein
MRLPLSNTYLRVLTIVLIGQAFLFYKAAGSERTPLASPLSAFPAKLGGWDLLQEGVVDKETQDVLKADDTLTRVYVNPATKAQASLFIAYFQSQRTGQSPHSPKNCLPGSGWQPEENDEVNVPVGSETIRINHYLVSKGDQLSLVYYWYQSQGRAIANEFAAKFYLVADSIRRHRSDTSLVRIIVPSGRGSEQASKAAGIDFVRAVYPTVKAYLPQ